jgi:pimeloyl-ACP methyl ester carboxylesterase
MESDRSRRGLGAALLVTLASFAMVGCRHDEGPARVVAERGRADAAAPSGGTKAEADAGPVVVEPARVERFRVPGDVLASVVKSSGGTPPTTVFLPGLCSNAYAYLLAFPEAARRQGGVVALEGDQPCGNLEGFRSFSWDANKLHARIEAAVAAAGLAVVPREGLTLIGYSQGAALGEQLVQRWPGRYARVVLIGAPTDPSAARFAEARAVVTMSCARDVPWKMKEATARFVKAGIPSTYVEMPGCTHGNITDGDRTFDAAFDWLRANARPTKEDAKPQPLVGEG